jgi:hypothetical protein
MLLGLSGSETDHDIRPAELSIGAGVPHGELLVRFVDASFESSDALAAVRDECVATLGMDTTVDAAAVIANFHMMTRIADSTGTPLDSFTEQLSGELRDALGLDDLVSTRLDPTA